MPTSLQPGAISGRRLRIAGFAILAGLCTAYLVAPETWGGVVFIATAAGGLISFAVGPLVHRPTNRRPWRWLTAAGAFFLGSLLLRLELVDITGPVGDPDLWSFAGYACTAPFLAGLLQRTQTGWDPTLWLDTAAITTGFALIGWVMNVAPQLTRPDPHLTSIVVNAVYPVMDAMLLTLTVQLGFRRGSRAPALQAALTGLTALLIGDLAYTFIWVDHPGAVNPYVNVLYLIAYVSLGVMACHPSMRDLSDIDIRQTPRTSRARLVLILLALLTPATIPVMLPIHGILDAVVRSVIMAAFGTVVFARLLRSIQALQSAEEQSRYLATHDGLTDLPNWVAMLDGLEEHLTQVKQQGLTAWVNIFLVGCDHFRKINDTWGHAAGDEALVQLSARLRSLLRPGDVLSRANGDQFVVRMDTDRDDQAAVVAEHIMAAFAAPLEISCDREAQLTATIGIAQTPYGAPDSAENMLRNGDQAYHQAKTCGRGTFAVHDKSMHARILRRHSLADALRGAFEHDEIYVMYQPIRTGSEYGELSGWEALARWDHPQLGAIPPVEFIPIAEDTGLIVQIGAFVLRTAAAQLKQWQEEFERPDLHMSVNVSSVQLMRDDVPGLVSEVLRDAVLNPEDLWLEITESVVLERTDEALAVLNRLTGLGVKLCMDDFGTGYSSLSYLKDFTVHILKVDKAFVDDLVTDQRARDLTKAIIDVASALGIEGVVAEGVESQAQADLLTYLGCSMAQGFLYGRPAPAVQAQEEARTLLGPQPENLPQRVPAQVAQHDAAKHSQTSPTVQEAVRHAISASSPARRPPR